MRKANLSIATELNNSFTHTNSHAHLVVIIKIFCRQGHFSYYEGKKNLRQTCEHDFSLIFLERSNLSQSAALCVLQTPHHPLLLPPHFHGERLSLVLTHCNVSTILLALRKKVGQDLEGQLDRAQWIVEPPAFQ